MLPEEINYLSQMVQIAVGSPSATTGKEGEMYYDVAHNIFYVYTNDRWIPFTSNELSTQSGVKALSAIDRTMLEFERIVNNHSDMDVRMRWYTEFERQQYPGKHLNQPDFWLGVAWVAYRKQAITKEMFTDILLAMKAIGANSDYFHDLCRLAAEGKL
jgi:hypothetical protein